MMIIALKNTSTKLIGVHMALCMLAFTTSPVYAITDGALDGENHPYVGLMVAQDKRGNPLWHCSGTLISQKLFLTAGHCLESPATKAEIWFDSDVESGIPDNGYPYRGDASGTNYVHPGYDRGHDLGMVVLDKPYKKVDEYGVIPTLGVMEEIIDLIPNKAEVKFKAVGYGLQESLPHYYEAETVRMYSEPHLIQINGGYVGDHYLMLSNNAATGGTCYGDSGGPNFLNIENEYPQYPSNMIVAVTSFGLNPNCGGNGGVYRVDLSDDLDFIESFFTKSKQTSVQDKHSENSGYGLPI